jgi:hypothetical protein
MNASPWIISARFDSTFMLAPAILVGLLAGLLGESLQTNTDLPEWLWLVLVVGIDAGHVYSTLFRTYLDKQTLNNQATLLTLTPLLTWLCGCLLYSINSLLFWRVLAYLAVFHFIRQQYGFMMLYSRHERHLPKLYGLLDKVTIYAATLCPLLIWHSEGRSFNWFIEDDFWLITAPHLSLITKWLYGYILIVYSLKEIRLGLRNRRLNLPRNLLIIGTALSWYVGIVLYDDDLIFTATNVIAHGIPYYALIWAYGYKRNQLNANYYWIAWLNNLFEWRKFPLYILLLIGLAYFEEGLWDGMVWREHRHLFNTFSYLPKIDSPQTLTWLVPLLTVPQATHYVFDAFIWRVHFDQGRWQRILFVDIRR